MEMLWDIEAGELRDQLFIKTAAVHLFGTDHLIKVGVVKGISLKGEKRQGLDPIALEGIRGEFYNFPAFYIRRDLAYFVT